jgi:mitochondrial import receptor subunit TOM40
MIDSNWTVGAVLEKRLLPLPFTLGLSAFLNHVKPSYKFGIGLTVGG